MNEEKVETNTSKQHTATERLDRTIYHIVTIRKRDGNTIEQIKTYATEGRYLSPAMMERALELEEEFKELNERLRREELKKKL